METPANLHQRRQWHLKRVIVIPTLIAGLAGFLASYLLSPKYSSRSLVVVQPANGEMWASPPFEDNRLDVLEILEQQLLARNEVLAILEGMGVGKPEMESSLNTIRENTRIEPAADNHAESSGKIVRFNIIYTDSSFQRAQQVCNGLTFRLLEDSRAQQRNLQRQVEDAANGQPTSVLAGVHMAVTLRAPCSVPVTNSPNRLLCAGAGLVAGLLFGVARLFA